MQRGIKGMKVKKDTKKLQGGVASIFVVIFFTLLLGVVTVSFVQITNQDQRQALNNDLSQSAYDSAQAGIEDAKRAIDECKKDNDCDVATKFQQDCRDTNATRGSTPEVRVSTEDNEENNFNQAYTCVNVTYNTPDYKNRLNAETTDFIPLKTVNDTPFSIIQLSWGKADDAGVSPQQAATTDVPYVNNNANEAKLPESTADWGNGRVPALLRIQLIQVPKASPTLGQVNDSSKAVFLYPQRTGGANLISFGSVTARAGTDNVAPTNSSTPKKVNCAQYYNQDYVCKEIKLTGLDSANNNYYLMVTPLYASETQYKIELLGAGGSPVPFDGVQPEIDATGRADDVFRRVETRVRFDDTSHVINYPSFDTADSLCKALSVGSQASHYKNLCE